MSPYYSLKYWRLIHRRVLDLCIPMGKRFFFLSITIAFARIPWRCCQGCSISLRSALRQPWSRGWRGFVQPPASMGRFKRYGLDSFDPEDIAFVKHLGFDVRLD